MLYLLDSSAVLNDFSFQFSSRNKYITTSLAVDEFRDMRSRHLMENALNHRILRIQEPSKESLKSINGLIREKGFSKLSETDITLLALALDFQKEKKKFSLITDDYSIQNFCSLLGIPFESVIRGKIKQTISFSLKCPACGKTPAKGFKARKCPICGSPLKRVKCFTMG